MPDSNRDLITGWLESVRPEHRELLSGLHDLIVDVEPGFEIALKWGKPAYSLNGEMFMYIADQSKYVQLGFYNGAQMNDKHGIIEGTGKRLRHIKVHELNDELTSQIADAVRESLRAGSEYNE